MKSIINNLTNSGVRFGVRHVQAFFMFLNITIAYFTRISASVAVVAMTNKETTNPDYKEFNWSLQEQSLILSSFYWGYVITQLPSGWFAQRYGAKIILFCSTLCTSILCTLIPLIVHHTSWQGMCAIRVLQGLSQGFIFPTMHSFLAKWSPFKERNFLGSFSHSGIEAGTILAFIASGNIAGSSMGWPGIYYICGGLGLLWTIFWGIFGASNPYVCKYITIEEKKYIQSSLNTSEETQNKKLPVPWKDIWLSVPFLALFFVRSGQGYGFSTLMNEIPKYMNSILDMNIQDNGLYSGIPYITMLIVCYTSIAVADFLTKKRNVPLLIVRKIFNSIAFWGPGLTLIGLSFITKDQTVLAIVLLILTVGLNGTHTIGSLLNHIDLSPNHAGILMGLSNTAGNLVALITPLIFSAIVSDKTDLMQWRIVFCIVAGIFISTNFIYLFFGQTSVQPWDAKKPSEDTENPTLDEKPIASLDKY